MKCEGCGLDIEECNVQECNECTCPPPFYDEAEVIDLNECLSNAKRNLRTAEQNVGSTSGETFVNIANGWVNLADIVINLADYTRHQEGNDGS